MPTFRIHASTRTKIVLLLSSGIIVREIFAPFTGHPYDFELWVRLGYYVSQGLDPYVYHPAVPGLSFPTFEGPPTWPGYPPIWPLFLALIYKFYVVIGIQNRFFYYFLIKQPMIVADILDAYLVFRLVKSHSTLENAVRAFAFWLLCPYTILISAIWGMFDQIILLFVLVALVLITSSWKSAILEALATALKLIPVIYFPLFVTVQPTRAKMALYTLVGGLFALFLSFAPYLYFRSWHLSGLTAVGVSDTNKIAGSMNYWEVLNVYNLYHPISNRDFLYFQTIYGWIWIPAILLASCYCALKIRHRVNFQTNLVLSSLFVTLTFFLTKYVINEQFLIYFLGFALIDYYLLSTKIRRNLFHAVWISALTFLIVNNAYLSRFFSPLSSYYGYLDNYLTVGQIDGVQMFALRNDLLIITSVLFSIFCSAYLISLYKEIRNLGYKRLPEPLADSRIN